MRSSALVEPESPRMSLTLDAVENNGLSPSLRRRAREGDFRDLCILTSTAEGDSHGSFVSTVLWAGCTQGLHHCLYSDSAIWQTAEAHSPLRVHDPRASRVGRVVAGVRRRARGDGIHGRLLEAGMERSRKSFSHRSGK